jgi:hypothetical protein
MRKSFLELLQKREQKSKKLLLACLKIYEYVVYFVHQVRRPSRNRSRISFRLRLHQNDSVQAQ